MKIDVEEIKGIGVAHARGKITIGVGDVALRECVQEMLAAGMTKIVLDFAETRTIDSSGVGELVRVFTTALNQQSILWFADPSKKIIDVLQMTQLIGVSPIFPTVEDAVECMLEVSYDSSDHFHGVSRLKPGRRTLYLGTSGLTELPAGLWEHRSLERLFIHYNQLTSLPAGIGQLTNLKRLFADSNALTALPPQIQGLGELTVFSLSGNRLARLPTEIGRLTQLKSLLLERNSLETLPTEIGALSELGELRLAHNRLRSLPPGIGDLKKLPELNLRNNRLLGLPPEIGKLEGLRRLSLRGNRLLDLPDEIGDLAALEQLDLEDNGLTELPSTIEGLRNLRTLVLEDNRLDRLPSAIGGLDTLSRLQLARNQLLRLPQEIGGLKRLSELSADDNRLTELPREIGALESLTELSLDGNGLEDLVAEIGHLQNLQKLSLNSNLLKRLPPEIGELQSLTELEIEGNRLTGLPPEVGNLQQLRSLRLKGNRIDRLPAEIGRLENLIDLDLEGNRLTALPPEIADLQKLRTLNLRSNQLHRLPDRLQGLERLTRFDLRENPISLPLEIVERTYAASEILKHLVLLGNEPRRALGEAKVLLVGQGGVGKTSIAKRLVSDAFDPGSEKTQGIEITPWAVRANKSEVCLNLWDFGGQEIMHATHQFFLTHRSVYLLLVDSRLGDSENRVEYWLKIIQSFAGGSPVILVGNKADQAQLDIDRRSLRSKYPNLRGIVTTSCLTGEGIEALQELLIQEIESLDHLFDEVPESWFRVKSRLSEMEEDFLTYSEYRRICEDERVSSSQAQKALAGFLHDLGIILNYRDDPRLEDTHILNPQWVTKGVYRILNTHLLFQNQGVLQKKDLESILEPDDFPAEKQLFILDMMRKFELCFAFEDSDQFLVPDLLPREEPYTGDWSDSLTFELHYDVLPSSILSRLIVRIHPFIHQRTAWRSGVVLAYDDNLALIRGDLEDAKITIRVSGFPPGRSLFLKNIRMELDAIHERFSGIVVEERVVVSGHEDVSVPYKHLKVLEDMGIAELVPEGTRELVRVRDLLEAVEVDPMLTGDGPETEAGEQMLDVFLAYNSKDKEKVRAVAFELRRRGLNTWLDSEKIAPGRWVQDTIREGLSGARSAAVFVGPNGLGPWQSLEVRTLLQLCIERGMPVIPVLLPGVEKLPDQISFLDQLSQVRFRKGIDEREALDRLEWGITGRSPFVLRSPDTPL